MCAAGWGGWVDGCGSECSHDVLCELILLYVCTTITVDQNLVSTCSAVVVNLCINVHLDCFLQGTSHNCTAQTSVKKLGFFGCFLLLFFCTVLSYDVHNMLTEGEQMCSTPNFQIK